MLPVATQYDSPAFVAFIVVGSGGAVGEEVVTATLLGGNELLDDVTEDELDTCVDVGLTVACDVIFVTEVTLLSVTFVTKVTLLSETFIPADELLFGVNVCNRTDSLVPSGCDDMTDTVKLEVLVAKVATVLDVMRVNPGVMKLLAEVKCVVLVSRVVTRDILGVVKLIVADGTPPTVDKLSLNIKDMLVCNNTLLSDDIRVLISILVLNDSIVLVLKLSDTEVRYIVLVSTLSLLEISISEEYNVRILVSIILEVFVIVGLRMGVLIVGGKVNTDKEDLEEEDKIIDVLTVVALSTAVRFSERYLLLAILDGVGEILSVPFDEYEDDSKDVLFKDPRIGVLVINVSEE